MYCVVMASFLVAGSAGATTYTFNWDASTRTGVLTDMLYNPLASVSMGDKVLSDVTMKVSYNAYAAPITASMFTLDTLDTPALNPGFTMAAMPLAVQANGVQDITLSFWVTAPASAPITDATLSFVGGVFPSTNLLASVVITEYLYTSATDPSSLFATLTVGASGASLKTYDTTTFAPLTSIYVVKDISLSGGGLSGGSAQISALTERFSEVPVPSDLMLFASGLIGLMGLRRRTR